MTRTAWTITGIAIFVMVVVAGSLLREPIMGLFTPKQPEPVVINETPQDPMAMWQTYATSTISMKYPPLYTLNPDYANDAFGVAKRIHGVSVTIPASVATGTNLSTDTRVSVEQLPRAKNCTADIYVKENVKASLTTFGGVQYSVATSSGAGAGNRYEEMVFALPASSPCTAVRYYIHSTAIGNYPEGSVREFDREALLAEFDAIRASVNAQ